MINGCTRGGYWADPLSTNAFRTAWDLVSNKSTVEETFEYNRGVSVLSDINAAIRSVLKNGSKPNDWRVAVIKREQQKGMTGSKREVTKCRLHYTKGGIFVIDGVNENDKNVHSRSRLINALVALGYTASFKEFDEILEAEGAKFTAAKTAAQQAEKDPLTKWAFVLENLAKVPTKRTVRRSDGSFASEVPFDLTSALFHTLVDETVKLDGAARAAHARAGEGAATPAQAREAAVQKSDESWKALANVNRDAKIKYDEFVRRLRDDRESYKRCVDMDVKKCKDAIEQSELERALMDDFDAGQRKRLEQYGDGPLGDVFDDSSPVNVRKAAINWAEKASDGYLQERRLATLKPKDNLDKAELTLLQKTAEAIAEDLKISPRHGGCRCLRSSDVCAVLVRLEPENPAVPGSPLVHRPVNANEALRRTQAYAALPEEKRTTQAWEDHSVLFDCKVIFETPNDFAAAYDGHKAASWPAHAVIMRGVQPLVKTVIDDIVKQNDVLSRSLPTKALAMHQRRYEAAINSVRVAPVVADSMLMFYPSGHFGIKPKGATDGAANPFLRYQGARSHGNSRARPGIGTSTSKTLSAK